MNKNNSVTLSHPKREWRSGEKILQKGTHGLIKVFFSYKQISGRQHDHE